MKKALHTLIILFCGMLLCQSCDKINPGTKNINLEETIQAGNLYTLDLGTYGDRNASFSISKQAGHFTTSQIDQDPGSQNKIYHFSSDTKLTENESVVLSIKSKENGRCSRDEKKTVVNIKFTIIQ